MLRIHGDRASLLAALLADWEDQQLIPAPLKPAALQPAALQPAALQPAALHPAAWIEPLLCAAQNQDLAKHS